LGEVLQPLWHVAKDVGTPHVCPALDELGRCLFETECGAVVGRRHAVLAAELDDLSSLLTASLEMLSSLRAVDPRPRSFFEARR